MRSSITLAAGLLAATALAVPAAAAEDDPACGPEDVVVVVDAEMLDGDLDVRCVPVPNEEPTVLTVVEDAGFVVEGTADFGSATVCRVDGFPTESEETCRSMPAADAFWGVWLGTDDEWAFAQEAVDTQPVAEGDVVGLAFQSGPDERQPAVSPADARDVAQPVDSFGRPQDPDSGLPWGLVGLGAAAVVVLAGVLVLVVRRRPS